MCDRNRKQQKDAKQLQHLDVENKFMDHEGVKKRREEMLAMLKHDRTTRRQQGNEVSSSDSEEDMRKVDVELEGIYGHDTVSALRKR